eukprot:364418-Chlamydomonas_euryale.AAC.20
MGVNPFDACVDGRACEAYQQECFEAFGLRTCVFISPVRLTFLARDSQTPGVMRCWRSAENEYCRKFEAAVLVAHRSDLLVKNQFCANATIASESGLHRLAQACTGRIPASYAHTCTSRPTAMRWIGGLAYCARGPCKTIPL